MTTNFVSLWKTALQGRWTAATEEKVQGLVTKILFGHNNLRVGQGLCLVARGTQDSLDCYK